jgi:hypothetical protein
LGIPLGQVFGHLAHQIDGAMPGDQALDVLIVGVMQRPWYLLRAERGILEESATTRGDGRSGNEMMNDGSRFRLRRLAPVLRLPSLLSLFLGLFLSLVRNGQTLAGCLAG